MASPQPGPAEAPGGRGVRLLEGGEQALDLGRVHTDAGVGDAEHQLVPVTVGGHGHPPLGRELDGVID